MPNGNTPTPLLERDDALGLLRQALADVQRGHGRCAVVAGEAGVGKSRLVGALAEAARGAPWRWLQAGCDALHTPRPLGPLVDLSAAMPAALADAVHAARTYNGLFPSLLAWLRGGGPPGVLVIEDLHWADEATLDCVRYLGRRLADAGFLLLLTLRPEALESQPPLRQTLAALAGAATTRIELAPLSPAAVALLARHHGRSAEGLHALTGGNPFFVEQILQAPPGTVPGSLRDAVLAQADALPPAARAAADLLCCSPGGLELASLLAQHPQAPAVLDHPAARALLDVRPPWVAFRHELARRVLEDALPPLRRWQLHAALLQDLSARPARPGLLARQVHHAAAAGLSDRVWEMAPRAAAEAAAVASYRAAVRLQQLALEHGADAPPAERAELLDRLALHLHNIQAADESQAALREALALKRAAGDAAGCAITLAQWSLQRTPAPEGLALAQEAVQALPVPEDPAAAGAAYSALAIALANAGRNGEALQHARHAMQAAEASGRADSRVNVGSIAASVELSVAPSPAAFDRLERCIEEAIVLGRPDRAAVPMVNLASLALAHGEPERVLAIGARGIAWCGERDLDLVRAHLHVRQALALGELARWPEMLDTLRALDGLPSAPRRQLASAAILRDRLDALRGVANDAAAWQSHVTTVTEGRSDLVPVFVRAFAAEAAWLRGDADGVREHVHQGLAQAEGGWLQAGLRQWLRRIGDPLPPAAEALPPPYAAAEAGDWRAAAAAWQARHRPYDTALALMEGDKAALREALALLEALDAHAPAALVRLRLQAQGVRGPYGHARSDPLGLTRREREIAELLAAGLSNPEIAGRMHRSEHTVAHHVSALLTKLGVSSRAQVAARLKDRPA